MAGKTRYVNFDATVNWAVSEYGSLFEPDPKYGKYKANFYLSPKSWEVYNKLGLALDIKNDDGGDYVIFKRDHKKMISGKMETLGPPKVGFVEGVEPTRRIGNGSECVVTVAVYNTPNGPAHRLQEVVFTNVVEFSGGNRAKVTYMDDDQPVVMDEEDKPVEEVKEEVPVKTARKTNPFRR